MRKELTDAFLRGIEPPTRGRVEYVDIRCAGLAFRITTGGARSWSFRFADPETGKVGRVTIGAYPTIGLSAARTGADDLRKTVAAGKSPARLKREARRVPAGKLFADLAARYMAAVSDPQSDRFKRSAGQDRQRLEKYILPKWRKRRYDQIRRDDVRELVGEIFDAGKPVQANRVQALASGIFSFAMDEPGSGVDANPCARLQKRGAEGIGRRVLSDGELRLFWPRIVTSPVSPRVGLGLRLALLTGARIGEVAGIARDELTYLDDSERAVWIVPGARRKDGQPHLVPLAPIARKIAAQLVEMIGNGRYLFPSRRDSGKPMDRHTFTTAMRRFGEHVRVDDSAVKTWRAARPSPHDLRRTVRTRLAALGVSREIRDHVLGHGLAAGGVGERHYNLYDFAREKRDALALWDAALAKILEPGAAAVVPLKAVRS